MSEDSRKFNVTTNQVLGLLISLLVLFYVLEIGNSNSLFDVNTDIVARMIDGVWIVLVALLRDLVPSEGTQKLIEKMKNGKKTNGHDSEQEASTNAA